MNTHPLVEWLKANGKTQVWLANEAGVRKATVSGWVNGTTPRPSQMQRIAEVTGNAVPVTSWFEDAVTAHRNPTQGSAQSSLPERG